MGKGIIIGLIALLLALGAATGSLAASGAGSTISGSQPPAVGGRGLNARATVAAADPCAGFPLTLQSLGDGKTTWGTAGVNGPFPNAVFAVSPYSGWGPTIGTSSWISPKADRTGPATTYYGTAFSVSQYTLNFATLTLSGSFLADNRAQVFFNGAPGPATTGSSFHNFFGPPTTFTGPFATPFNSNPNGNSLVFKVEDDGLVTGLDYSATVTCAPLLPDLQIVKTASPPTPPPWVVGSTHTFTTKVTNLGPGTVPAGAGIVWFETLPVGLTETSTSPGFGCVQNVVGSGGNISCVASGPLAVGASVTITWTVKVNGDKQGTLTNCVSVSGQTTQGGSFDLPEVTMSNNKSCVDITVASLAPPLDHFKCYVPKQHIAPNPPTGILLRDQFAGGKFRKVGVKPLFRFCNPVKKVFAGKVTPIRYPALHLSFYGITAPLPGNHTIVLSNQFGSQKIVIGPAKWIAVPTSKNSKSLPSPKLLNHFECYPVLQGRAPKAALTLIDQWHAEKGVVLGGPVIFCNPAEKMRAGRRFPLVNASAHLTCYRLAAKPFAHKAMIRNQFNRATLAVSRADMLCVPSLKLRHVP